MVPTSAPVTHDVVLLGGGHAHVEVLRRFAMEPVPGVRLTCVAREIEAPYSGMLPGLLACLYTHDESHIDLWPLARAAGARLYRDSAVGLDFAAQAVLCDRHPPVAFDLLSIDIGSEPSRGGIEGADRFAISIRPVSQFLSRWADVEAAALDRGSLRLVMVGGGVGGVEAGLALHRRMVEGFRQHGLPPSRVDVTIVTDADRPMPTHGEAARRRMVRALDERGIRLLTGHRVVAFEAGRVLCEGGRDVPFDAAVLLTPAAAAKWIAATGLARDPRGFITTDDTLRSISHATVFAAGDIASVVGQPREKSGVFAVRAGVVLAENLRRAVLGRTLRRWRPQRRALALISTGDRRAVASMGPFAVEGASVWRQKDRIDRAWMQRYQHPPAMRKPAMTDSGPMRCGGCAAKVPAGALRRALARLGPTSSSGVIVGVDAFENAAAVETPPGRLLVQSVDYFPAFIDDPYVFGRITANHCLNDLYAMGAEAKTALAQATLPPGPDAKLEADLFHLLKGAHDELAQAGATLVGGHSGEGSDLSFGLAVSGHADPHRLLRKRGAGDGDVLILTKALGTGTLVAASAQGEAKGRWIESALDAMLVSNLAAMRCFIAHGVRAMTDVSGFGLVGHLGEMLEASGVSARLDGMALPILDGVDALLDRGVRSTLDPANRAFGRLLDGADRLSATQLSIIFDPQTSGGLLASLPADRAAACLAELRALGYGRAAIIGRVESGRTGEAGIAVGPG